MAAADLGAVFERLKAILASYASRMHITDDAPGQYALDLAPEADRNPTTWFGGVRLGKRYVSYYLMPVYVEPSLLDGLSPDLRRRMQGKSCFNFTTVDETLLAELETLTRASHERTGGDPTWGTAKRVEHGMAHRRASEALRPRG